MRLLKLLVLAGLLLTQGCAVVAVGAVAAAAPGVTYTVMGTAEKTYNEEYDAVLLALQKSLASLDIKTGDTKRTEENEKVVMTEITAYARELTIHITVERVSEKATRVVVDASKNYFVKDAATGGEILNQTTNNLPKKP
jgi:hypothetical protein